MAEALAPTSTEELINLWNGVIPEYIDKSHLTDPLSFLKALVCILNKHGMDTDGIIVVPIEEAQNSHVAYYRDLLPVMNLTKIINHFMTAMKSPSLICIQNLLQPSLKCSHSILLILLNLMFFSEQQLQAIAPNEEEMFLKMEKVKSLEEQKVKLLNQMNEWAQDKGARPERLEKLKQETKNLEEETKLGNELRDGNKQLFDMILNENRNEKIALEQAKSQSELLQSDAKRLRSSRVTDAEEIGTQMAQLSQEEEEVKGKLSILEDVLRQKENSLKNLQIMKPHLENSNSALNDIMNYVDWMKDFEVADPESNAMQRELDALQLNLSKLERTLENLKESRNETIQMCQQAETQRELDKTKSYSKLKETEEETTKSLKNIMISAQRTEELKKKAPDYKEQKVEYMEMLEIIENNFRTQLAEFEEVLLSKARETEKYMKKLL